MKSVSKLFLESSSNIKLITFPKSEHKSLIKRLKNNKQIITTRVSNEFDKYNINDILFSDLGYELKVLKIKNYQNIKEHPYYNELTKSQIDLIDKYSQFQVIWLIKNKK
jgi:hypothetical protein